MPLSRRRWLAASLGFPAVLRGAAEPTQPLDDAVAQIMRRYGIPGAALGIARAGRIVYARGFGLADRDKNEPVTAQSRFRIASVTKPLTAAAVLRLCELGKLTLDEPVLPRLGLEPLSGTFGDSRLGRITSRQLLQHTGGWNKAASGDPMFKSPEICRAAGIPGPADAKLTIRWVLGRKLDHEPGTRYSYSNVGYCILGRLIEAVTGQRYADAMRRLVLDPCGAGGIELGRSLERQPGEVCYYHTSRSLGTSVFPTLPAQVAWPYGTFSMEANDANGGFIASVSDVLKFLTSMDEEARRPLLRRESLRTISQPGAPGLGSGQAFHGLGWFVSPNGQGGRPNLWYNGILPGAKCIAVRLGDGFDWVFMINSWPGDVDHFSTQVQNTIHAAARQVPGWG